MKKYELLFSACALLFTFSASLGHAQVAPPIVECGDPFEMPTTSKPPLDISALPQPDEPYLVNAARAIGYSFIDDSLAFVATPTSADCFATVEEVSVRFAGVVWRFDGLEVLETYVVAMSMEDESAFLLDPALLEIAQVEVVSEEMDVPSGAVVVPPFDVSIRAFGICFIMADSGDYVRHCIYDDLFSVVAQFGDPYAELVEQPILDAVSLLSENYGIAVEVSTSIAVSEIEQPNRIEACLPGNSESTCAADVVLAPTVRSEDGFLAVLAVTQALEFPNFFLEPGSYALRIDGEATYEAALESAGDVGMTISGETTLGEPVEAMPVPAVVAPFINSEDVGLAEIYGLRVFFWCCFGECQ